jgi:TFIIF-interacting CTD phosphatase-like protein
MCTSDPTWTISSKRFVTPLSIIPQYDATIPVRAHVWAQVASWYTLVIYTASMPEYADPVIDWLDGGRGLFAKKLYRESCHLQLNGSYIKDLSLVEQDLSRVCFMDNSPISYSWNKGTSAHPSFHVVSMSQGGKVKDIERDKRLELRDV